MFFVGRKLLIPLGRAVEAKGELTHSLLAVVLMLYAMSAFFMDAVGIHAVFGGFLLGACMPRGLLTEEIKRKIEPMTVVFLLPMFFTYSGLNTQLTTVNSLPCSRSRSAYCSSRSRRSSAPAGSPRGLLARIIAPRWASAR
jgi:Kef-type K+ transport system membrane component KefB